MAKITLPTVNSTNYLSQANENFALIAAEFQDKAAYRDNPPGETNTITNDFDMDGNRVFNLPEPVDPSEAARLQDVLNATGIISQANLVNFTPAGTISSTNVQAAIQELDAETQAALSAIESSIEFNVKEYGAIGNGIADDTAAIQATVLAASLKSPGATIYFPDGLYFVTATITLGKNYLNVRGQSKDGVQIFRTSAFGPIFKFSTNTSTILDGMAISDLRLIDNGLNNSTGVLIEADNVSRFCATNITSIGGTSGIVLKAASNVLLKDIFMYMTNPAGVAAGRHGVHITSTAIVGPPSVFGSNIALNNVNIYGGDNVGATFANLDSCLRIEAADGVWIGNSYFGGAALADVQIKNDNPAVTCGNIFGSNNMMDITRGNGILINGTELCQRIQFDGIVSCAGVGSPATDGILIAGPVNNVILRNTVDGWTGVGVHIGATAGMVCTNVAIVSGNITNNNLGVQIEANVGTNQIIVTGNNLAGNSLGAVNDLSASTTLKYLEGNLAYSAPWVDYTPVIGSNAGSITAVATGRFKKIGSTVYIKVNITSVSADTGTGFVTFSLPSSAGIPNGIFALAASNMTTNLASVARTQTSNLTAVLLRYDGTYPSAVGQTFAITGMYEVP